VNSDAPVLHVCIRNILLCICVLSCVSATRRCLASGLGAWARDNQFVSDCPRMCGHGCARVYCMCVRCAAIRCGCVVVAHLHDTVYVTVVMCSHGTCMPGMVCVLFCVSACDTHMCLLACICCSLLCV